ncbi:MAG: alanine dehydrogenase [Candidatus Glassbacteria bacterium]
MMVIGVPKELPLASGFLEKRAGLTPGGVRELTGRGIAVFVESGAGSGARFSDEDYRQAGANVVYSKEETYGRSDLVVKVEKPAEEEWGLLRERQAIMAFMHLVNAPKKFLDLLISKKITAIGYEIIQSDVGDLPILKPISQIAGKMSLQIAARLMESKGEGFGILIGGIPGIPPADVVIIGGGTLGYHAARTFYNAGARVFVLEKDQKRLEELDRLFGGGIVTAYSSERYLERMVSFADVLITAVLVPGAPAPVLVTREMVQSMKRGSVIIDFSIDQGGCVETSRLTPGEDFVFVMDGVIHYCVPNVSSNVARTASRALTHSTVPYLLEIAAGGLKDALLKDSSLQRGLYTCCGYAANENLKNLGIPYGEAPDLLKEFDL